MHRIARTAAFSAGVIFSTLLTQSAVAAKNEIETAYQEQIAALRAQPAVADALDYVLAIEQRSHDDLIELTEIPAPPFKESQRAARFAELLQEAGLTDVTIDEVGNVIGRRPGKNGERVIAFSAHLDTVFPEGTDVTVRTDGKKLRAPGIGDNSRGLVVVLGVLRALQHANVATDADVLFIGNVGEEGLGDLRGVKHLFRDGAEKIDALIAVDGGRTDRIVYGGVGSHRYRVTFKGPGGHSWGAFGTANPHHALGRAIALFDKAALPITKSGVKTSYNVGRIGGGTSVNSVPFESWMEVDLRSGDQKKIDEIDAALHKAVAQALRDENAEKSRGAKLTVDMARVGTRPAARGDRDSPLVQRAMAATSSYGIRPQLRISSTDANLPISLGVPAVTMSRGGEGGDAHAPSEWWRNDEGHVAIQIGILTLLAEAGFAN
ncbi:MAG: M20/M25/M40 family metallo-hydrolase [Woeseia sp.]